MKNSKRDNHQQASHAAWLSALGLASLACVAVEDEVADTGSSERAALIEALAEARTTDCLPADGGLYSRVWINSGQDEAEADFVFGLFADDACSQPFLELRTVVRREVGEPIAAIPAAFEVDVVRESLSATPWTAEAAEALAQAGCGDIPAEASADVSSSGCFGFESVDACGFDYDIAALVDGVLYGGERGENMCVPDNRPTALGTLGFALP